MHADRQIRWPTDLAVIEGSHAELVDPLRDGRVDILVGALRQESAAEFVTEPLFRDIPLIVGRAGHPLKNLSGAIDGKRLLSYPWIVPGKSTPLRTLWRRMFEQLGEKAPHVAIECGSGLMIRQILIASDHLTLLSADQISVELEAGWLRSFGPAPGDLGYCVRNELLRDVPYCPRPPGSLRPFDGYCDVEVAVPLLQVVEFFAKDKVLWRFGAVEQKDVTAECASDQVADNAHEGGDAHAPTDQSNAVGLRTRENEDTGGSGNLKTISDGNMVMQVAGFGALLLPSP
jgi:hypothetical protein